MHYQNIPELTKRIESILSGYGQINDYSGQVVAEAIVQLLREEGLIKAISINRGKKSKK